MHFQTEDGVRKCTSKTSLESNAKQQCVSLEGGGMAVFLMGVYIAALLWRSVAVNKITQSQRCEERAIVAEYFSVKSNSQCLQ